MTTSGISTTKPNFIHRFKGFGSAHARYRDPRHKVTRLLLWVLEKGYRRDARTDFTQNTSNDAVPHKEVPFEGRETNIPGLDPHFPQNRHFGGPFRRNLEFFRPKTALTVDDSRVNDP